MNVVRVAAGRHDLAAAVSSARSCTGPGRPAGSACSGLAAVDPGHRRGRPARVLTRRGRRYVPIVGPPGSLAMVTVARRGGRLELHGPAGRPLRQQDRRGRRGRDGDDVGVAPRPPRHRAAAGLRLRPREPDESRATPRWSRGGHRAVLPATTTSDHFAIYHPPLVSRVLADQTAFLKEHLDVRA